MLSNENEVNQMPSGDELYNYIILISINIFTLLAMVLARLMSENKWIIYVYVSLIIIYMQLLVNKKKSIKLDLYTHVRGVKFWWVVDVIMPSGKCESKFWGVIEVQTMLDLTDLEKQACEDFMEKINKQAEKEEKTINNIKRTLLLEDKTDER